MAKIKEDPPKPGAAWMNTFADLMNLLLCFFVLLFSMSTIDAEKFKAVAESMAQTFSIFQAGATAIGDGVLLSNGVSQLNELDEYINSMGKTTEGKVDKNIEGQDIADRDDAAEAAKAFSQVEDEKLKASEALAEKIEEALDESEMSEIVQVSFNSNYVLLTMSGTFLFDSGKADIQPDAIPVLDRVGRILERYADQGIEIEGHTDTVPCTSGRFENNDVLSSYRALAVFNYFEENTTLDPAQMKHSGRGEYCPVADNSTAEGRAKNRRVEIKVFHELSNK